MKRCVLSLFLSLGGGFLGGFAQPGSLDVAFADQGHLVVEEPGVVLSAWDILMRPDGSFITVCQARTVGDAQTTLMAFEADGSPDIAFGSAGNGVVQTDVPGAFYELPLTAAYTHDGKIMIGGSCIPGPYGQALLLRYHPDGRLDSTWGTDGYLISQMPDPRAVHALHPLADGRLLVLRHLDIVRYDETGTLDTTFGHQGVVPVPGYDMVVDATGAIYVAFVEADSTLEAGFITLTKLLPDGQIDSTFGNAGIVSVPSGTGLGDVELALAEEGKVLLAMDRRTVGGLTVIPNPLVLRYLPDGTPDSTFGQGGRSEPLPGFSVRTMVVLPDSTVLLGGQYWEAGKKDLALMRIRPEGGLDLGFGNGGFSVAGLSNPPPAHIYVLGNAIGLTTTGHILCAGWLFPGNEGHLLVSRFWESAGGTSIRSPLPALAGLALVNPASGQTLQLYHRGNPLAQAQLELFTLSGQRLLERAGPLNGLLTLPVGDLARGTYLLRVASPGYQPWYGRWQIR